jgi:hypothetical protein
LIRNVLGLESGGAAPLDEAACRRKHVWDISASAGFAGMAAECIFISGCIHINTTKRHDQGDASHVGQA